MSKSIRHEKPLSKTENHGNNPNKITINQHVIPSKHILEWSTNGKMVDVYDIASNKWKKIPASDAYFCAMRLWDQWTEAKQLKTNEDNFQKQIDLLRDGLSLDNHTHITAYYVMLCVRIFFSTINRPHYPPIFSDISRECSKSELEDNELGMEGSAHFVEGTIAPDSQHMSRQVIKSVMFPTFVRWCQNMNITEETWELYNSNGTSFILSDALYSNYTEKFYVIPISPTQALIAKSTYQKLYKEGNLTVDFINRQLTTRAVKYFIAVNQNNTI